MSTQQKRKSLRRYVWIALGLIAIILLWILATQNSTAAVGLNKGELAPEFTLTDLNGNQVSLSDFRGKTVFLNFWATWCPACRVEMPDMQAVYQEYKDRDVVIIGIDIQETAETVSQFVGENGYGWTFLLDTTGMISAKYEIVAIPTSYFIDKNGIIQAINVNAMTKPEMEAKLAEAMR